MTHISRLPLFLLLATAAAAPAFAQLQEGEKPTQEQVAAGEAPAVAFDESERVIRRLADPTLAPKWKKGPAKDLLAYVERIGEEGLDPADYDVEKLRAAIDDGDSTLLSNTASDIFLRVSADLATGHASADARVDWHVIDPDLDAGEQFALMKKAIDNDSVRDSLDSLLPTHPQYAELKGVLSHTTEQAKRDKIRTNLERWRWLPRDLGPRYVIVNVPAYTVALVENGQVVTRHNAVVGAVKTPTPQLSAIATGVILNPWWEVPTSISGEVRGKKGYVAVKNGESVRYRQPPGPSNALGRIKVVMPNNQAIYLHDTPSKSLFAKAVRAFSHGCIRTQDPLGFAELLLDNPKWDKAAIDAAVAAKKTIQAQASAPTPVYITYFTAAAAANTNELVSYRDIYGRDAPVATALNRTGPAAAMASSK
ncbi:MAG: L,D-transpeptidase [Alphaproteobacteria bacterium]|nr:MAG: L,D-transpeptidase [Alphaproteobacteria bacterium]